jgi:hypothetical protein
MPDTNLSNSAIIAAHRERTPRCAALAKEAVALVPGGRASCPPPEAVAPYSPMSSSA